jgi:transcriptional repressor NF-X1
VRCNRCEASPVGRTELQQQQQQPKCNAECGIAKRNARLADAFGINPSEREKGVDAENATYSEELVSFARANTKFAALVEKTFAE